MKTFPPAQMLMLVMISFATSVSAQNLPGQPSGPVSPATFRKAESKIPDDSPLCLVKNSMTLDSRMNTVADVSAIIDADLLREPSIYRADLKAVSNNSEEILRSGLALLSATYRETARPAETRNSSEVALSVRQKIKIDPSVVLDIVGDEVSANPSFACEIVKAAIQTTNADSPLVVNIVDTAIHAAPEAMRLISQCAIAAAPESLSAIQALLTELDPNGSDSGRSSKSSKNWVDAVSTKPLESPAPNPLDLPPLYPIPPGPIMPPVVTNVDP